jgi:uncharacterized protein (TIGR03067 family)
MVGCIIRTPPGGAPVIRATTFALFSLLVLTAAAAQDPRPGPWEHKAVKFTPVEKEATDQLNTLAADGWEYVGPLTADLVAFRRPVLSPEEWAAKKELDKFQGVWTLSSYDAEGRNVRGREDKWTLTVRGNTWVQKDATADEVREFGGTFANLDPARKPPAVDLVNTDGPFKGTTNLGVYRLDADRLTLCWGDDKTRPTEVNTRAGDRRGLMVWQRRK